MKKIFIIYAREDSKFLSNLNEHLQPLVQAEIIKIWCDKEINAGAEWEKEIIANLENSDIILVLVSPAYYGSEYIHRVELAKAIERHNNGESKVIPILIRYCSYVDDPLISQLQIIPTGAKPVSDEDYWRSSDRAWLDVVDNLKRVLPNNKNTFGTNIQENKAKSIEQRYNFRNGQSFNIFPNLPDMIFIEGGNYDAENAGKDNATKINANISDFFISNKAITQAQWKEIMGNNPSEWLRKDNINVDSVNWFEIQEFIENLNLRTGKKLRLPTEVEWEYAMRGGKHLPFGKLTPPKRTHKPESRLIDYIEYEWCEDWANLNDTTSLEDNKRPVRGIDARHIGNWAATMLYVTKFDRWDKTARNKKLGFRLASDELWPTNASLPTAC